MKRKILVALCALAVFLAGFVVGTLCSPGRYAVTSGASNQVRMTYRLDRWTGRAWRLSRGEGPGAMVWKPIYEVRPEEANR